ncbi:hypothetical protein SUGI_0922810 [Cryptomeria japonica]|nr:hypothetical protein SUGI_0922810 [Cryptomeria japonica]
MPIGLGVCTQTRDFFLRLFKRHDYAPLVTYLRTYKIWKYVDIKVNENIHKGMPHKFYHSHSDILWNITKRDIGVEINKHVGNRIIKKRIYTRIEHVQLSFYQE